MGACWKPRIAGQGLDAGRQRVRGGGERDRTADPRLAKPVLSQTELRPRMDGPRPEDRNAPPAWPRLVLPEKGLPRLAGYTEAAGERQGARGGISCPNGG